VLLANNNLALFKAKDAAGNACLVGCNVPDASEALLDDVHALEKAEQAPFKYIVGSDVHHLFVKKWANAFPGSTLLFPSGRAPRLHQGEGLDLVVLDRELPAFPGSGVQLIPFRGFAHAALIQTAVDEKERAEVSVYAPASKVLFLYDVLIPNMPQFGTLSRLVWGTGRSIWINFNNYGFKLSDKAKAMRSAQLLLDLDVEHVLFAHGTATDIVSGTCTYTHTLGLSSSAHSRSFRSRVWGVITGKQECAQFMTQYFAALASKGEPV